MRAPSRHNDGTGSLLYSDGTIRFRVWRPSPPPLTSSSNYFMERFGGRTDGWARARLASIGA